MILLKPLSCQKFLYNISVTKTNEPQNDRAKVQIKYEKFIFIGVFFRLFCLLLFSLHNTTKKTWRKSLRHAPIKENLIVKIEISDF